MITPEVQADKAKKVTQKLINAYGKDPTKYDAVEQEAMSAIAFGTVAAYFKKETDNQPGAFGGVMIAILSQMFLYEVETATQCFYYFIDCTKKGFHPTLYNLIHYGIELYFYLDGPTLGDDLRKTIASIQKNM